VTWGELEEGAWRITGLSIVTMWRVPGSGGSQVAEVEIELTRASDAQINISAVSGGASATSTTASGRTHVVVKGQTLSGISTKYYGTPSRWREIAAANGIRDPRQLPVGKKLVLP
jgi:nucleoid-associated protein YgaU